jgi:hypothetical protein
MQSSGILTAEILTLSLPKAKPCLGMRRAGGLLATDFFLDLQNHSPRVSALEHLLLPLQNVLVGIQGDFFRLHG